MVGSYSINSLLFSERYKIALQFLEFIKCRVMKKEVLMVLCKALGTLRGRFFIEAK